MSKKKVALACSECGSRNYSIAENVNRVERLEVKKFCKYCGKHTIHRETKQFRTDQCDRLGVIFSERDKCELKIMRYKIDKS